MSSNWRITSFSGVLLAAYFIPTWAIVAWDIVASPVRGLFERPSVAVALYATDHLQLPTMTAVRFAWLLALGRMTVVAFFALFLLLTVRAVIRKQGSVMSFASMVMASQVGEAEALRLHAAELLMMLGTVIVMVFDGPAQPQAVTVPSDHPSELPLQETQLSYNG
jgi:hypothetical protein